MPLSFVLPAQGYLTQLTVAVPAKAGTQYAAASRLTRAAWITRFRG
ncbi:MAG: hypothetical protein ACM3OF_01410 [Gemmatimonas sp.]|jgi:hypothetical protein